jgi:NADH-ubiquinone oxidoreductase complex I, 21 kDa subunit
MPTKVVNTPYPLIDADPHASRVIRYFRRSDYVTMAAGTAAFPGLLYLLGADTSLDYHEILT